MEQITDIKAIQELLFGCLSHFKTICEKHRLTYYLSNGTLCVRWLMLLNPVAPIVETYRCAFLKRLMSFAVQDEFHPNPRGIKRIVLWMLYYFSRAIGTKRLKEKLLRIAVKSNKNSPKNYCGPVVWTCYNKGESIRSEVFSVSVTIKFHGSEFNAPVGYDEYLRGLYGDYEPDPPPEKQKSNHFVTIYSKS